LAWLNAPVPMARLGSTSCPGRLVPARLRLAPARRAAATLCWTCPSTCSRAHCQVHPTFYVFAVLMLLRVDTEFTEVVHRLCVEVCAGDISRMQHVFVRVAGNLGEAFLLGLAIRHLERAVSFPYFPLLLRINCVPCSRSVCYNSGDNSSDEDGKSDTRATTTMGTSTAVAGISMMTGTSTTAAGTSAAAETLMMAAGTLAVAAAVAAASAAAVASYFVKYIDTVLVEIYHCFYYQSKV